MVNKLGRLKLNETIGNQEVVCSWEKNRVIKLVFLENIFEMWFRLAMIKSFLNKGSNHLNTE